MKQLTPFMVDYMPDGKVTAGVIKLMNSQVGAKTAQELATEWASTVAAIAYMLRHTNTREKVIELTKLLAEDACDQYEHRQREIAKLAGVTDTPQ